MPIDPKAVGLSGGPVRRSWTSKDALLYALGVGAGVDELAFTTENTKDTPQRVLPTMAVVLGGGGIPFDKLGSFNAALMLHGGQGIELFDEIPPDGEIESRGTIAAIWDKGKAASVDLVSDSVNVATGQVAPLYLALDQGMVMAALTNALLADRLQSYLAPTLRDTLEPLMRMEQFGAGEEAPALVACGE